MANAKNGGDDHATTKKSTPARDEDGVSNESKPPKNKRRLSKDSVKRRSQLADELEAMSDRKAKLRILTIEEVAVLFARSAKTLEKDRAEQRAAIEEGRVLAPNHPASLKFEQSKDGGPVTYFAAHAIEHLLAKFGAADNSGAPSPLAARSFQGWMEEATAIQTWPFTIREDGRPVDMLSAVLNGATTGKAEALTPKEFAERFAQAALASFHRQEAKEIGADTPEPTGGDRNRREHP